MCPLPTPVTPDPRWGGGNSRADSDESSEHGYAGFAQPTGQRRPVVMNLAAANPEAFGYSSKPVQHQSPSSYGNSGGRGEYWGEGAGVVGGGGHHSHHSFNGGITEDTAASDAGSDMYQVVGGVLNDHVQAGPIEEDYGQYEGGIDGGGSMGGYSGHTYEGEGGREHHVSHAEKGQFLTEENPDLLPLPTLSQPDPQIFMPVPRISTTPPSSQPNGPTSSRNQPQATPPATRSDGHVQAAASPVTRTTSIRSRARSVNVQPGQLLSAGDASPLSEALPPAALSPPRSSSSHHSPRLGSASRLPIPASPGSSSPSCLASAGGMHEAGQRGHIEEEPMDTEALEADLAAVLRRLPASSRYGSRDGASELVASGVVQQLYARVTRLQVRAH
jgi:hypothetical protein